MSSEFVRQLVGNAEHRRISATDLGNVDGCPRSLAVKTRPAVSSQVWRRRYEPERLFVLGMVVDLVEILRTVIEPPEAGWIDDQLERRRVHRLLRRYVRTAVENVMEAHADLEDDAGALRLIATNPEWGRPPRTLTAWCLIHDGEDGLRQVHRVRLGSAREAGEPGDRRWALTAARVALTVGDAPQRVQVVEIGAGDASTQIVLDLTPEEVAAAYDAEVRPVVPSMDDITLPVLGQDCAGCQVLGACEAVPRVPGLLGDVGADPATRSVSASALRRYRACPGQWLLGSELHLPHEQEVSEGQARGIAVHRWLEIAHARGVGCTPADLPVDDPDFAAALPFLEQHVEGCPLATDGVELVAVEPTWRGFDADADVLAVMKPDLVYAVGGRLVVRETKTSPTLPGDADHVMTQQLQVPFGLAMLAAGMAETYGFASASFEVETLTPVGSNVVHWDTDDEHAMSAARAALHEVAAPWREDSTWSTTPGPQCTWCDVRCWCPDADVAPGAAATDSTPF